MKAQPGPVSPFLLLWNLGIQEEQTPPIKDGVRVRVRVSVRVGVGVGVRYPGSQRPLFVSLTTPTWVSRHAHYIVVFCSE